MHRLNKEMLLIPELDFGCVRSIRCPRIIGGKKRLLGKGTFVEHCPEQIFPCLLRDQLVVTVLVRPGAGRSGPPCIAFLERWNKLHFNSLYRNSGLIQYPTLDEGLMSLEIGPESPFLRTQIPVQGGHKN